ncbi:MAG: phosphopantetheine-binding protein [Lachnospiraceae bacterium]|nr:phosphopantetheine-binding protein [Lachnospiraceae bacterium]
MQSMEIEARLKELLYEIDDEIDVDEITEESRLKEDVGLSSVAMLYMAVSIENEFEIDLSDANMNDLVTVGDVVELIEKYL